VTLSRLMGVHPDLVRVIEKATDIASPFIVTEGLRDLERQKRLVKEGKSRTLNSRHLTGHAVDLAVMENGKITWAWPAYERLARDVKAAAALLKVPVVWGGDWKGFRDGVHFELDREAYPA
jgi:peptidoglycan L-alanyl-D-glutamate endopeptidase CwlK